ncbi:DUF2520 domain-containing protein [bacterium]|nr:DUF2520 domain-containing protein [bacterium]MCI0604963.1 DUF2520 domain-containing protein [bacterium]
MAELQSISWIGCGKVGRTLARALQNAGYKTGAVICRTAANAGDAVSFIGGGVPSTDLESALDSTRIHFITTNDDALQEVVEKIVEIGPDSLETHYFFHTSGSISSTVLEPLARKKAQVASIHPLQVFADPAKALETLPGIYYAIEGSDKAMELAVQIVDHLQGKLLLIPTGRKVLYHVAGVFAANYLMVLIDVALHIMQDLGETQEDSFDAFLPLMVGALQNVEDLGVGEALTGPVARGDAATIKRHLEALQTLTPEVGDMYKILGQEAVKIALRAGKISPKKAQEIAKILTRKETVN